MNVKGKNKKNQVVVANIFEQQELMLLFRGKLVIKEPMV